MFNLRVPLPARDEVFLMNTLTDAQLVVSRDVAEMLDRCVENSNPVGGFRSEEWEAVKVLTEFNREGALDNVPFESVWSMINAVAKSAG